jgi:hypothetical protein
MDAGTFSLNGGASVILKDSLLSMDTGLFGFTGYSTRGRTASRGLAGSSNIPILVGSSDIPLLVGSSDIPLLIGIVRAGP